jgi:hypothetical protein
MLILTTISKGFRRRRTMRILPWSAASRQALARISCAISVTHGRGIGRAAVALDHGSGFIGPDMADTLSGLEPVTHGLARKQFAGWDVSIRLPSSGKLKAASLKGDRTGGIGLDAPGHALRMSVYRVLEAP